MHVPSLVVNHCSLAFTTHCPGAQCFYISGSALTAAPALAAALAP
jgi:hypothetical protein